MSDTPIPVTRIHPGEPIAVQPVNPFKSAVFQGLAAMVLLWIAKRWKYSPLMYMTDTDAKDMVEYLWGTGAGLWVLWGRMTTSRPIGFGDSKTITPVPATKG